MSIDFSEDELKALRAEYAPKATDTQFTLWIAECKRRDLVPVRDVVLQIRSVKEWDESARAQIWKNRMIMITTIGALRKIAERTNKYAGQQPIKWYYLDRQGHPTVISTVPLPQSALVSSSNRQNGEEEKIAIPWAAEATILRKDFDEPLRIIARFGAYAQYGKDDNNKPKLTQMWATRGPEQLAKCAEAAAIRTAFPDEAAGLYLDDEMAEEPTQTDVAKVHNPINVTTVPSLPGGSVLITVPQVDHTPATPTTEPAPKRGRKPKQQPEETKQVDPTDKKLEDGTFITDMDLPDNIQKPAEEKSNPIIEPLPTKEEKIGFAKKIREYNVDTIILREWLLTTSGKSDTSEITRTQWTQMFNMLDAAKETSAQALSELIRMKHEVSQ